MAGRPLMNSSAKIAMGAAGEMYLDTAIIVKLLVREADSEYFNTALSGHPLDSSELCLTEVCSALLSKERAGAITAAERERALDKLEQLVNDEMLCLIPLDLRVLQRACTMLTACHPKIPLRTLDALHVATCDLNDSIPLATTDQRMRAAAAHFGIRLVPASLEASST
jgi:predicted nucleic acid-binding protein